jgi:hypothetical protein
MSNDVMSETRQISAADLRAEIARARTPRYVIAALAGMHPATLGLLLNEWKPLPAGCANRILAAIKRSSGENHGGKGGI